MRYLFVVFALIFASIGTGQTTLLHRKMKPLLLRNISNGDLFGKRDIFVHRSFAVGGFVPEGNNKALAMKYADSYFVKSSVHLVFNRSQWVSPVVSYGLQYNQMAIAQNELQPLSFGKVHSKQQIRQWSCPVGFAFRYNWHTRGFGPGIFSEVGAFLNWNFVNQLFELDKTTEGENVMASKKRSYYDRPSFLQKSGYGLEGRIGMGHVSLCLKYRTSHMFKAVSDINGGAVLPDFTPWQVGIEINTWNRKKVKEDENENEN
jgi:hypothetical protein